VLIVIKKVLLLRRLAILLSAALLLQILNATYPGWFVQSIATVANANRLLPIYSVEREDKVVALSFDAAWGADYTDELLAILAHTNVRATFFLVGFWVEKYPAMAFTIAEAGHEIGNHSMTHPHMTTLSVSEIEHEISRTHALIEEATGQKARLFRPPFGDYNNRVIETLDALGYYTIQWSIDSLDWKQTATSQSIYERVVTRLHNGAIILFHNNATYTPQALLPIITTLKERGYSFVPIGDLLLDGEWYIDRSTGQQRKRPGP